MENDINNILKESEDKQRVIDQITNDIKDILSLELQNNAKIEQIYDYA